MKTLLLIFILNQGFASEILTVAHKKKLQPDGHGTIQITEKGIVYQAKKSRTAALGRIPTSSISTASVRTSSSSEPTKINAGCSAETANTGSSSLRAS